jgi:hypothetical protein
LRENTVIQTSPGTRPISIISGIFAGAVFRQLSDKVKFTSRLSDNLAAFYPRLSEIGSA